MLSQGPTTERKTESLTAVFPNLHALSRDRTGQQISCHSLTLNVLCITVMLHTLKIFEALKHSNHFKV